MNFVGKTVAFVGKVDRVEDGTLYMKTAEGKLSLSVSDVLIKNALIIIHLHFSISLFTLK